MYIGAFKMADARDKIYNVGLNQYENWYKAFPYGFRAKIGGNVQNFYLPISPSNLNIVTHFATNIVATAYGTVEEHSEQRYFDITIAGTTGLAPRYYDIETDKSVTDDDSTITRGLPTSAWSNFIKSTKDALLNASNVSSIGRTSYQITNVNTGGFFNRTKSLIENTVNKVVDLFGGDDEYESGVDYSKSGYAAFHNFYRFLLQHKKDISTSNNAKGSKVHPLIFVNYKDNNQYNVAIQTFQLIRSADDPMLYKYNIVMRGYRLSNLDAVDKPEPLDKELGLDSVVSESIRAILHNKVRAAKNALASAIAATKGLGS